MMSAFLNSLHKILPQDTVTGFILAGIGHRNVEGQNFLIVKSGTSDDVENTAFGVYHSALYS